MRLAADALQWEYDDEYDDSFDSLAGPGTAGQADVEGEWSICKHCTAVEIPGKGTFVCVMPL